jgi:hypothetical protein
MCLVPGLLSSKISKPSERARKLAQYVRYCSYGLIFVGFLRLLSFSLWAFFTDVATGLYGLTLYRASFAERDRVVPLESVLSFGLVIAFDLVVGSLTLASLITRTNFISSLSLAAWQFICGYVISGIAFGVYLVSFLCILLLYRELTHTVLIGADEASSFNIARDNRVENTSFVPTGGTLPPTSAFREQTKQDRFPGKGYKLEV